MKHALAICIGLSASSLAAEQPLSAIDWLSDSVRPEVASPIMTEISNANRSNMRNYEPPVAPSVQTHVITVTPLDDASSQAIGSRLPQDMGLAAALWAPSTAGISSQIQALPRDPLPILQSLIRNLMIARAAPPADLNPEEFALIRVDHLLTIGALQDARQLLENAGITQPNYFRRYFDIALITGHEEDACQIMDENPSVAPTFAARVFCLARGGEWSAASLTLYTAHALGDISPADETLLAVYLDHELFEDQNLPPVPDPPSPLHIRLFETIGAPLPHGQLPRAYLHSDLRPHMGWKTQVSAAEKLASYGSIPSSRLMQFYSHGRASASGGVWERVKAAQAVEAAFTASNPKAALASTLPNAWRLARENHLEIPFAQLWAPRLVPRLDEISDVMHSRDPLAQAIRDIVLLSNDCNILLANDAALATFAEVEDPRLGPAIADALLTPVAPIQDTISQGSALLAAIADLEAGRAGDRQRLTAGLKTLRGLGMDSLAAQTALQILLLDRAS